MSEEETAVLRGLMAEVVEYGTGTKLRDADYSAAGKTGSAEYGNVKGESHAWFTGFAPADDPQVCVTVIIEGAGSGGDYAVPVARRILDAYFKP
jgi:peptidoglycan glycosyltransferase